MRFAFSRRVKRKKNRNNNFFLGVQFVPELHEMLAGGGGSDLWPPNGQLYTRIPRYHGRSTYSGKSLSGTPHVAITDTNYILQSIDLLNELLTC